MLDAVMLLCGVCLQPDVLFFIRQVNHNSHVLMDRLHDVNTYIHTYIHRQKDQLESQKDQWDPANPVHQWLLEVTHSNEFEWKICSK